MEEEKTTYDNAGNKNFKSKLLIGIIILLVISNALAFYLYQKSMNNVNGLEEKPEITKVISQDDVLPSNPFIEGSHVNDSGHHIIRIKKLEQDSLILVYLDGKEEDIIDMNSIERSFLNYDIGILDSGRHSVYVIAKDKKTSVVSEKSNTILLGIENEEEEVNANAPDELISVEWNEWPVKTDLWKVFNYKGLLDSFKKNPPSGDPDTLFRSFIDLHDIYEIGKVEDGLYKDSKVYIIDAPTFGMGGFLSPLRIIKTDDKIIYLSQHSADISGGWGSVYREIMEINDTLVIANLEPPREIRVPNSNLSLSRIDVFSQENRNMKKHKWLTEYKIQKKLFKYDGENFVYKEENDCFIVEASDGTAREYYLDLDIGIEGEEKSHYAGVTPYLLDFTFLNGNENSEEYIFKVGAGGCGGGSANCYNYIFYIDNANQLEIIGTLKSGDPVYVLKNINVKADVNDQKSILETMHEQYYPGYDQEKKEMKEKVSLEEFLLEYPLVLIKDPFGDYIEMKNAKYLPAVECGKPVIYLYPKTEMNVSVQVEPKGGFSITEPAYNNGWLVKASPNGELFNYADQEEYPYLFWEGFGINYQRPEQGFIVAKENVKEFLEDKLAYLGLVKHEYDEFIEFWLPKMQEEDYYFITFVPQSEFDLLAPLTVEPKPDTVIRIFMDYEGLNNYIEVPEQALQKGVREGFTVIEWGGALHR
jgi:hypothetical protein